MEATRLHVTTKNYIGKGSKINAWEGPKNPSYAFAWKENKYTVLH